MQKLFILFALMGLLSSCSKDDSDMENPAFVPGEVIVGIKSGTDIHALFNFINEVGLEVDNIHALTFTSLLPPGDLQFVLDILNEKNYTNDGINWFVNGYVHRQTNQIWIFPRLFDMHTLAYQQDWLTAMDDLKLQEEHIMDLNSGSILFKVPKGQEIKWENKFETHAIVDWAELNYIADIELHNN